MVRDRNRKLAGSGIQVDMDTALDGEEEDMHFPLDIAIDFPIEVIGVLNFLDARRDRRRRADADNDQRQLAAHGNSAYQSEWFGSETDIHFRGSRQLDGPRAPFHCPAGTEPDGKSIQIQLLASEIVEFLFLNHQEGPCLQ